MRQRQGVRGLRSKLASVVRRRTGSITPAIFLVGVALAIVSCGHVATSEPPPEIATPSATPTAVPQPATLLAVGDIGSCNTTSDDQVAALAATMPGTIAMLGDTVYESGTAQEFADCFEPAWGQLISRIKPAVGNHEYLTTNAKPYYSYFGAAAGDPTKGYYSYSLGAWHIIALNSNCSRVGGCSPGSPQEKWLKADLAANSDKCVLAYWHHPRFSSGEHGDNPRMSTIWNDLYLGGADVVLSGHDHDYERFVPMDGNGNPDSSYGVRQFVVGTGGKNHYPITRVEANSEVQNDKTFGLLKLTLSADGYDWQFVASDGGSFTDSGSSQCHDALPATAIANQLPIPAMPASDSQPEFPIRAAFYYAWYPDAWKQGGSDNFTAFHPVEGAYDSDDPAIIQKHIEEMEYGNIQAGIVSWWGPGQSGDTVFPALLEAAANRDFRWSVYYEAEGYGNPDVDQIAYDIRFILSKYGSDPAYLRVDGRPVIFVYADSNDNCSSVQRWKDANALNAYIVFKVFSGYRSCPVQPDGWHQYGPATPDSDQTPYSYTISPGFDMLNQAPKLSRDLPRWVASVKAMIDSEAQFELITTFNEWGEGTAVEPASEWSDPGPYGAYLEVLHENGGAP